MRFFLIVLLFLSTSCSRQYDYIDDVDSVVNKEIKKICKNEKLEPFAYGGAMCDGIKEVTVRFVSYKNVDIPEARRMIVGAIENIRNAINDKDELKEYLIPSPFPTSGLNVGILFFDDSGGFIERGCVWLGTGGVSLVSSYKGFLFYSSYNPRTELLERYFEETYEDAIKALTGEQEHVMGLT